jgi:hypothetical protein
MECNITMIKPTMSHAANKADLNELLLEYFEKHTKDLEAQVAALEEMIMECTSHGELDSRLFNSYMEHARKQGE